MNFFHKPTTAHYSPCYWLFCCSWPSAEAPSSWAWAAETESGGATADSLHLPTEVSPNLEIHIILRYFSTLTFWGEFFCKLAMFKSFKLCGEWHVCLSVCLSVDVMYIQERNWGGRGGDQGAERGEREIRSSACPWVPVFSSGEGESQQHLYHVCKIFLLVHMIFPEPWRCEEQSDKALARNRTAEHQIKRGKEVVRCEAMQGYFYLSFFLSPPGAEQERWSTDLSQLTVSGSGKSDRAGADGQRPASWTRDSQEHKRQTYEEVQMHSLVSSFKLSSQGL